MHMYLVNAAAFPLTVLRLQSLTVHNFYAGQGTDRTGVPTKLVTLNCSLKINVHNPSTMFGIHVSSSSIRLMYSEIAVANGQVTSPSVSYKHDNFPCAADHSHHASMALCSFRSFTSHGPAVASPPRSCTPRRRPSTEPAPRLLRPTPEAECH